MRIMRLPFIKYKYTIFLSWLWCLVIIVLLKDKKLMIYMHIKNRSLNYNYEKYWVSTSIEKVICKIDALNLNSHLRITHSIFSVFLLITFLWIGIQYLLFSSKLLNCCLFDVIIDVFHIKHKFAKYWWNIMLILLNTFWTIFHFKTMLSKIGVL